MLHQVRDVESIIADMRPDMLAQIEAILRREGRDNDHR